MTDADFFLPWVETVFGDLVGPDKDGARSASQKIMEYFDEAVTERRRNPLDPKTDMVSRLIEECLRLYPLVIQAGRLAPDATEFNGLRIKAGEIMWLGIGSANRDPRKFADPTTYDPR